MADLNEVRLIGRLTRNPDIRTTPSGHTVASFGLATGRKYKGSDGILKDETTFVDITCWGKQAEFVGKYLTKGRQIFVGGRLKFESWEDKNTGQKRNKLTVVANNIQFLDSRRDQAPAGNTPYTPSQQTPDTSSGWGGGGGGGGEPDWGPPADMGEPPF